MTAEAECPYCGHVHTNMYEVLVDKDRYHDEYECGSCGRDFWLEIEPRLDIHTNSVPREVED